MSILSNILDFKFIFVSPFSKALRLAYEDFDKKYQKVVDIHDYLVSKLKKLNVSINSSDFCLPHMVNISLHGIKSEVMLNALDEREIYVSTQTACSTSDYSKAVYSVTHDKDRASRSMRISLSYLTTRKEIDYFIENFSECIDNLSLERKS